MTDPLLLVSLHYRTEARLRPFAVSYVFVNILKIDKEKTSVISIFTDRSIQENRYRFLSDADKKKRVLK